MDIIATVVALAGVAVAALSVWLAYRGRVDPYQKSLYDLQIAGASEAMTALVQVQSAIDNFALSNGRPILADDAAKEEFRRSVVSPKDDLRKVVLRYSPFLPAHVFAALSEYLSHLELVVGEMKTHFGFETIGRYEAIQDPWDHFYANFAVAVVSLRDFLGVGPLTSSIAKTVGATRREPDADVEARAQELIRLLQRDYDVSTSPLLGIEARR